MRRFYAFAALVAVTVGLGACGGTPSPHNPSPTTPTPRTGPGSTRCTQGVMGGCTPPTFNRTLPNLTGARVLPDVSEYQSCALYSEAIIRVYEAGTERQDTTALCHAQELHRKGAWGAAYAFLRPGHGGCVVQADRTVRIVQAIGGVTGPIVADAEVPLPRDFVACFNGRVRSHGYPAVTYTSTGTASGGPFSEPLWLASYGARPGCVEGICRRVAWQFSSEANCRGVYGDCSVDEGITSILRKPPVDRKALQARRRALRRVLLSFGCRRREHAREHLGPRCRRWKHEGDLVNAALR